LIDPAPGLFFKKQSDPLNEDRAKLIDARDRRSFKAAAEYPVPA
jgi:hypothetical protein